MVVQSFDKPETKPMWNRGINGKAFKKKKRN